MVVTLGQQYNIGEKDIRLQLHICITHVHIPIQPFLCNSINSNGCEKRVAHKIWSRVIPEKAAQHPIRGVQILGRAGIRRFHPRGDR